MMLDRREDERGGRVSEGGDGSHQRGIICGKRSGVME